VRFSGSDVKSRVTGSGQCHRDLRRGAGGGGGGGEQPAMTATGCFFSAEHQNNLLHKSGQEDVVENLWQKFFSDPLQWWDNRSEKVKVNQLLLNSH
jgi:hypothetical protein